MLRCLALQVQADDATSDCLLGIQCFDDKMQGLRVVQMKCSLQQVKETLVTTA